MKKTLWTKNFTLVTTASALGAVGGIAGGFALSFLVFDETGSTLASALVLAISLLPGAVLPLLIAPLMDHHARKPFLVGGDAVNALLYALAAFSIQPLYTFTEWVPENVVEWSSLKAVFWNLAGDSARLVRVGTRELRIVEFWGKILRWGTLGALYGALLLRIRRAKN